MVTKQLFKLQCIFTKGKKGGKVLTITPFFFCLETTKTLISLGRYISHGYLSDLSYTRKWERNWNLVFAQQTPAVLQHFYIPQRCTIFLLCLLECPVNPGVIQPVQPLSHVRLFTTAWIAAHQAFVSITSSRSAPKLTYIESVTPFSHLILCRPLLLLPPIPPSIRVFSNESTLCMRWPKYWSFSLSNSP